MGILRSPDIHRAQLETQRRQPARRRPLAARSRRGLHLEPMEERMLMAIGAGPDLDEIVPNDGAPLVGGDVRHVSPRELVVRFDSTQVLNPATLSAIQISRSGGDGFFTPGLLNSSVINATSSTVFAGDATLSAADDFYNGKPLTFTSGPLAGQIATVTDYIGSSRTFIVAPALAATPTPGDAFQVNLNTAADVPITPALVTVGDRSNEVVIRFADRLPDDFYRVHIVGSGAGALANLSGQRTCRARRLTAEPI
jgi:hypothetical protein